MQPWASVRENREQLDADAVLRALLAARGADDRGAAGQAAAEILQRPDAAAPVFGALAGEAEYHGVAPLIEPLIARLAQASPAMVSEEVRRVFLALAARHRRMASLREACIDDLLAAFAAAGIRMILLKGAALAHLIYPDPALRAMVDIDILIDSAAAASAAATASALGYRFASGHSSRLAGAMHHLPVATLAREGFAVTLEIHLDAMSPNQPCRLAMSNLAEKPQVVRRGGHDGIVIGHDGLALGHVDMLRHLARHAFEPARRIRLIHLYDLWRYPARFHAEIDWRRLAQEFPDVIVILRLVAYVFGPHVLDGASSDHPLAPVPRPAPAGVGQGMPPLLEIAEARASLATKLAALLNPPAWWMHGFYGVPPEASLFAARTLRHPGMMARWIALRFLSAAGG
jgi:hypothetical protein